MTGMTAEAGRLRGIIAALPTPFREGGSVTAGNASGVNDGAAALACSNGIGVRAPELAARGRLGHGALFFRAFRLGEYPCVLMAKQLRAAHRLARSTKLPVPPHQFDFLKGLFIMNRNTVFFGK